MATSLSAIAFMGLTTLAVGLTPFPFFGVVVVAMGLTGIAQSMANGPIGAALQACVPPELQGRVFTLVSAGAAAMMPLGLALAGPLSDIVGADVWFLPAGASSLVLGVAALFVPSIVRLDDHAATQAAPAAESGRPPGRGVADRQAVAVYPEPLAAVHSLICEARKARHG